MPAPALILWLNEPKDGYVPLPGTRETAGNASGVPVSFIAGSGCTGVSVKVTVPVAGVDNSPAAGVTFA